MSQLIKIKFFDFYFDKILSKIMSRFKDVKEYHQHVLQNYEKIKALNSGFEALLFENGYKDFLKTGTLNERNIPNIIFFSMMEKYDDETLFLLSFYTKIDFPLLQNIVTYSTYNILYIAFKKIIKQNDARELLSECVNHFGTCQFSRNYDGFVGLVNSTKKELKQKIKSYLTLVENKKYLILPEIAKIIIDYYD